MNKHEPEMSMLSFANDCNERADELEKLLLLDESMSKRLREKMGKSIKDMRKQSKKLLKFYDQIDSQ